MSEDDSTLVFGFRSGQASIVSVKSNQIQTFQPHRLDINSVSISADGSTAFTGASDKLAVLWNTNNGEPIKTLKHQSRVNYVVMDKAAKVGFTLDAIKDRFFWLLSSESSFAELGTNIKFIEFNDAKFVKRKNWMISGSPKQKMQLWDVKTGELLGQWQTFKLPERDRASVMSVELIAPDKLASFSSDGVYQTWPVALTTATR